MQERNAPTGELEGGRVGILALSEWQQMPSDACCAQPAPWCAPCLRVHRSPEVHMRRLALGVSVLAGLIVLYGFSPIMAWLALVASAAFVFSRRMSEVEPAPAER